MIVERNQRQCTIIYSSELYNTEEMRKECRLRFRSTCHTEVLLTSYAHYGLKCLDYLNGIYAFAI